MTIPVQKFINVSIDIFFIFSVGSGSATKSLFPLFLTTVTYMEIFFFSNYMCNKRIRYVVLIK